ncbi:MAG: J domain-containing protein [Thermoplasmata archaeon]|nr:MAG: J domain-containing protein [Thermoplasmata archaeon]
MTISNLNYYELLEIPRDASKADIKRAYRKMAEEYHPDKTMHLGKRLRELANLEMTRINKAKEVLVDDDKRRRYDEYLDGTRTEDLEDIILEVDPFEEYEEENWEEIREEFLEVEPLEEAIPVEEQPDSKDGIGESTPEMDRHAVTAEPPPQDRSYIPPPPKPRASPVVKMPFWERLKTKVQTYEMGAGLKKRGASQRTTRKGTSKSAGGRRAPPPPPVPPPPPGYRPDDRDIKINIISTPQGKLKEVEVWDKYARDAREIHDDIKPIEMEIVDEDGRTTRKIQEEKKKALAQRKSRLKGLEPKDDYEPKWTSSSGKGSRIKEERRGKKEESEEDPMDLEPMKMELVRDSTEKKRRKNDEK